MFSLYGLLMAASIQISEVSEFLFSVLFHYFVPFLLENLTTVQWMRPYTVNKKGHTREMLVS